MDIKILVNMCQEAKITPFGLINLIGLNYYPDIVLEKGTISGLLHVYEETGSIDLLAMTALEMYKMRNEDNKLKQLMKDIKNIEE